MSAHNDLKSYICITLTFLLPRCQVNQLTLNKDGGKKILHVLGSNGVLRFATLQNLYISVHQASSFIPRKHPQKFATESYLYIYQKCIDHFEMYTFLLFVIFKSHLTERSNIMQYLLYQCVQHYCVPLACQ